MKHIIAILLFILPFTVFCQDNSETKILDRLSGLKVKKQSYFSLGSYTIFAEKVNKKFTPKNIKKLKKKYKLKKEEGSSTENISSANQVIHKSSHLKNGFNEISTLYIIEGENSTMDVIAFYSINFRDIEEEENFINLYVNNKITESVFMKYPVSKFDFAGRELELPNLCNWMDVHVMDK